MKSVRRLYLFAIILLLLNLATARAEAPTTEPVAAQPAIDSAEMERMQALMSPNANHKALEPLAGMWKYTGKFWMTADSPAQEMTGTAVNELIFGGRFLKQEIEGPWMGQPFNGLGYTGYDNIKNEYISVWFDSMSTGMMTAHGTYEWTSKTFKLEGENSCPLTGEKNRKGRSSWTVIDDEHNVYISYSTGPDGRDYKTMEIFYTRAAA